MNNLSETLRMLADDIEQRPDEKCWQEYWHSQWLDCTPLEAAVVATENKKLRPKPKLVERTISYPEPMREAPEESAFFWVIIIGANHFCEEYRWNSSYEVFIRWLERGLCHTTKEAAIAHAKALIGECDE